jgi:hydrogenase maturation protease
MGHNTTNNDAPPDVAVLGIGNLLLRDEGIGIHVLRELDKMELPENIILLDGGTFALESIYGLGNVRKLIVIDAVDGGGPPGAVYRFRPEDVENETDAHTSLHSISFLEILKVAALTGDRPAETIIIGVQPEILESGTELSPCLQEKMPQIVDIVLKEIHNS